MVDNVLDLSKIEEGKLEVDSVPFSLQRVMDQAVAQVHKLPVIFSFGFSMFENCHGVVGADMRGGGWGCVFRQEADTAEFKGLQLYCTQDPGCSTAVVCGDRLRVQQIVANFARNAVEYTKSGWVELKMMEKEAMEEGKFRFLFTVSDSGKGMSEEERERVFAIPQKEEESAVLAGAGLGLVVCRKLASLMGGTVSCDREVGGGSTFSLELEVGVVDQPLEGDDVLDGQVDGMDRWRGVVYCTVGEWSTPEEIAAAQHISPTFRSRGGGGVVHDKEGKHVGRAAPVAAVGQVGVERGREGEEGDGMSRLEEEPIPPTLSPEAQQEGELRSCLERMEWLYGGVVEVSVVRDVVERQEVAVLVEVTVCLRKDGSTLVQQQEWGSAARAGSLGDSLRAATQNAVLPVLRGLLRAAGEPK